MIIGSLHSSAQERRPENRYAAPSYVAKLFFVLGKVLVRGLTNSLPFTTLPFTKLNGTAVKP